MKACGHVQRSAKRRGCLISYSQAEPGRDLTQPSSCLLAEPCRLAAAPFSRMNLLWMSVVFIVVYGRLSVTPGLGGRDTRSENA